MHCKRPSIKYNVFVDASMMHLIAIILQIFKEKSWFGLATNYPKKCVRKPNLANLGTGIFKKFSLLQTVVLPSRGGNTNYHSEKFKYYFLELLFSITTF